MPQPVGSQIAQLAKVFFVAEEVKLPVDWEDMGDNFPKAFEFAELIFPPNPPMTLFVEQTLNKYHVKSAKDVSDGLSKYIDGICNAIASGIGTWMGLAKFSDIKIVAVCAIGAPGCLTGPEIKPFILSSAPMATPQEQKYSQAIAKALSKAWKEYQDKIIVPGLPWYPAFAAFPGPQAPPMPNVPVPLMLLPSPGEMKLSPKMLKDSMVEELDDEKALHHEQLFDSIAKAFYIVFQLFKLTTMVTNVMGKGPIPTFLPPFVPVGPVMVGDVLPIPGVLV